MVTSPIIKEMNNAKKYEVTFLNLLFNPSVQGRKRRPMFEMLEKSLMKEATFEATADTWRTGKTQKNRIGRWDHSR
jgi:glutathione peroxidase-family protein